MTVGRPRIFDEDTIERDERTLLGIFDAGVNAGYTHREMAGLVAWLQTPIEPARTTVAKYRSILAELVQDGTPPRRRKHAGRRMAAIALLAATGGTIAQQVEAPQPVRAHAEAPGAPDDLQAPIMYVRVNRRRRRSDAHSGDGTLGSAGFLAVSVRTECAWAAESDAHAMATAA